MSYKNKKQGFTIFEVMLALLIFSFAIVNVYILLKNMLKTIGNTKKIGIKIEQTPFIYSSQSPLLIEKTNKESTKDLAQYYLDKISLSEILSDEKNKIPNIENIYIGNKQYNKFDIQTLYSNFFMVLPEEKKGDDINVKK